MVSIDCTAQLLRLTTSTEAAAFNLAERRHLALAKLGELVDATAGFWAWGHGHPYRSPNMPLALIDFGLTPELRSRMIEVGLSPEMDKYWRMPIAKRMGDEAMETTISRQIDEVASVQNLPKLFAFMESGGWSDWMHSVRYSSANNWSNLFLLRANGKFDEVNAATVDFTMQNVQWLHATSHDYVSDDSLSGLTSRQRTVMLLLLDGLPRKVIARRLSLSEDTVGDHIKAIYEHFDVGSATELAALFLRSK